MLSPLLFNILMSDFPSPPAGIEIIIYADDIIYDDTILVEANNILEIEILVQEYRDLVAKWGENRGMKFSAEKTCHSL